MSRRRKGRKHTPAAARAWRRRRLAAGHLWVHVGGGTMIARIPGRMRKPCDDQYENLRTGEMVVVKCTLDAHFNGLRKLKKVTDLRQILRVPGVTLERRWKREASS